jgi:hypothetical protein
MNPIPNRIVVYPKDVMNITGRRERTARLLLTRIRKKLRKKRSEFISLEEFCSFTGLKPEHVTNFLT